MSRRQPAERERLRAKGQFWTPDWIAQAMVAYVLSSRPDHVFDPAVGEGAFFRAAKLVSARLGHRVELLGIEKFPETLEAARGQGLTQEDLGHVRIADFLTDPPQRTYAAIVANPPYIRHHRLSYDLKQHLKALATQELGRPLDGRAGLHVYFLIRALRLLEPEGRLAFIVPSDTVEGIFANTLWKWITTNFCLERVITFDPEATPFPDVDTNPLIIMISNSQPRARFEWIRCRTRGPALLQLILRSSGKELSGLQVFERDLAEALSTGLSRFPSSLSDDVVPLSEFARVSRGIATGANSFFLLTKRAAEKIGVPNSFLVPAVGRTRDVVGTTLTPEHLDQLDARGRPTRLLYIDGRPEHELPDAVREYIRHGESLGLPARPLLASRKPWYKMERRVPPPFLFAYLGRRNARFIRNLANAVPLTSFLCVYPRMDDQDFVDRLWNVLSHPDTLANLHAVAKSYGSGAIKVEPRALERLPIPVRVLAAYGLDRCETRLL